MEKMSISCPVGQPSSHSHCKPSSFIQGKREQQTTEEKTSVVYLPFVALASP